MTLSEKFWSDIPAEGESLFGSPERPAKPDYRIDHTTGCWEWIKGLNPQGYPGRYAHRLYFKRANPSIDIKGLDVHHRCHNKICVNPAHLDAVAKGHHQVHHRRLESILTEPEVAVIRASTERAKDLAAHYGVTQDVITNIWLNRDWTGIGPIVKPTRLCAYCGSEVPQERKRHAQYCDNACKASASYRRRYARDPKLMAAQQRERRRKAKESASA